MVKSVKLTKYRLYAGGDVVHQDDFEDYDPRLVNYWEFSVPEGVGCHRLIEQEEGTWEGIRFFDDLERLLNVDV